MKLIKDNTLIGNDEIQFMLTTDDGREMVKHLIRMARIGLVATEALKYLTEKKLLGRELLDDEKQEFAAVIYHCLGADEETVDRHVVSVYEEMLMRRRADDQPICYSDNVANA